MGVAPVPRQVGEWLRHEGRPETVGAGDLLDHELEEGVAVCRGEGVRIVPVDLELAVRVLVVVLVGPPAERFHVGADLRDHLVTAKEGGLVVAGLGLRVPRIGNVAAIGVDQVKFGLDARHQDLIVGFRLRHE